MLYMNDDAYINFTQSIAPETNLEMIWPSHKPTTSNHKVLIINNSNGITDVNTDGLYKFMRSSEYIELVSIDGTTTKFVFGDT